MRSTVAVLLALACAPFAAYPVPANAQPLHEVIDREINRLAGGELALPCDDATFMRRVYLDLAGRIPSPDDVPRFLADGDPAKRTRLVDQL